MLSFRDKYFQLYPIIFIYRDFYNNIYREKKFLKRLFDQLHFNGQVAMDLYKNSDSYIFGNRSTENVI